MDSYTLWYTIEMCIFENVNLTTLVFLLLLKFSQKQCVVPSMSTPKDLNLNFSASLSSVAILRATNLDPKVELLILLWHLVYYTIGVPWTRIITPIVDLLLIRLLACAASQNVAVWTKCPSSWSINAGISCSRGSGSILPHAWFILTRFKLLQSLDL